MTTVLLSTLGTGCYSETTYRFPDGREYKTSYCTHAIAETFQPDETIVFLTEGATSHHWDMLRAYFGDSKLTKYDIPNGATQEELWHIFRVITDTIAAMPGAIEIYLDVTHAFRSLPLLLVIAVAYLRQIYNVTIKDIFYGAYEAKVDNITPVFSLLTFVTLFDWINGVDAFSRTGDSAILAQLLRQTRIPNSTNAQGESKELGKLADTLEKLTLNLELLRLDGILSTAAELQHQLKTVENELPAYAHPFTPLLKKVSLTYGRFALASPRKNLAETLDRQLKLISWFIEHGRFVAATLLAREWFISWQMFKSGYKVEEVYNSEKRKSFSEGSEGISNALSQEERNVWDKLRNIRNDVGHVSYNRKTRSAVEVRNNVKDIYAKLEGMFHKS